MAMARAFIAWAYSTVISDSGFGLRNLGQETDNHSL
jgi:hypothetical protein